METKALNDPPPCYKEAMEAEQNQENIELQHLTAESQPLNPFPSEKQPIAIKSTDLPEPAAIRSLHSVYEDGKHLSWCHPRDYTPGSIITTEGTYNVDNFVEIQPSEVFMCGSKFCMALALSYGGFVACVLFLIFGIPRLPPDAVVIYIVPVVVGVGLYIFILIDAFTSDTKGYLKNKMTERKMKQLIEKLATTAPDIKFSFSSKRVSVDPDIGSNYKGCLQYVEFSESLCLAEVMEDLPKGNILRVEFDKMLAFKDNNSKEQYERIRDDYYADNRHRGQLTTKEVVEIPGFIKKTVLCRGGHGGPFLNRVCYFLASVLLLSYPYRWWFRFKSTKCRFTFVKIIG